MIHRIFGSRRFKAYLLGVLDPLFIKNSDKILFVVKNRTYFSGNLRVTAQAYIEHNHKNLYVYKDGKCPKNTKIELEEQGIRVLDGFSIVSIYHIVTAGVIILSHNPRDAHITKKFKSRKIINLWHGVAIKAIENLMPEIAPLKQKQLRNNARLYDMVIASSKEDKKNNTKAFGVESKIVRITGLPRYEILKSDYKAGAILQDESKRITQIKNGRRLVLYAPTFRESNISPIEQISAEEWQKIEKFAIENNILFGIRPHPYDTKELPKQIIDSQAFYLFESAQYTESNILLGSTDILVVDFTSIWIDYLLLKRPIIGFARDRRHYLENERGFVYDLDTIFPSRFLDTVDDLIVEMTKAIKINSPVSYPHATKTLHDFDLSYDFKGRIYEEIERLRADG